MSIQNRKGQNIVIHVDKARNSRGLIFVMHGLGGFKEQPFIKLIIDTANKKGFTIVSFDTTNSFGKSDGDYSDATVTGYFEDLEDVIGWAKNWNWYREPFILVGHSLGGLSASLFAEKYPLMVKALAPFSAVVSGRLWKQIQNKDILKKWKKEKVWIRKGNAFNSGVVKILKWAFVEDIARYDLLKNIKRLTMPVLLIVGSNDTTTPAFHQKIFFEKLPGKKELHVINGAEHVFQKIYFDKIRKLLTKWLDSIV